MTFEMDEQSFAPGVVESVAARPWPVVGAAILGCALALALTRFVLPERYTATATATIADPYQAAFTSHGAITADYERYLAATASFAESQQVMDTAASTIDGIDGEDISAGVAVTSDVAARTLDVTATADDADDAAARANAVIEAFDAEHASHLDEQTEQTMAALDEQIEQAREGVDALTVTTGDNPSADEAAALLNTLQERKVELAVNAAAYGSGVEFIEPAKVPAAPASPDPLINGAVGLLLGCLAGMSFVWLRADRQRSLSSSDAPGALLDMPLLGKVPDLGRKAAALSDPRDMPADEYQFVASAIRAALADDSRILLVGGVGPGVGTTVTAANVAVAAARDDLTVAVVDASENESLGAILGQAPYQAGMLDLLSAGDGAVDRQRLTWALGPVSVGSRSIRLLSLGASSRATMASQLRSRAARELFDELRSRFDLIVVDCGSVSDAATTGALARSADAMALVIGNGCPSDAVVEARERLEVDRIPVVGYVFTRADRTERRRFRTVSANTVRRTSGGDPAQPALKTPATPPALPHSSTSEDPEPLDGEQTTRMNGVHAWPMPAADPAVAPATGWRGSAN